MSVSPEILQQVFSASYSPDPNIRVSAELELKKLEGSPGLISGLLQIISPNPAVPVSVRQAASIYLKNRVQSSWRVPSSSSTLPPKYVPISDSDRDTLRNSLIPLLGGICNDASSKSVKLQLASVLGRVIDNDFPTQWPNLVQVVIESLGSNNEGLIEAGLLATVDILRCFRYAGRENAGQILPSIITTLFPGFLQIAQHILATPATTPQALSSQGTIFHLILKSYRLSITHVLIPEMRDDANLVAWGTVFMAVIGRTIDPELYGTTDSEERDKHEWTKAVKWSVWCLNRLFTRFGNRITLAVRPGAGNSLDLSPESEKITSLDLYGQFADHFSTRFVPDIMRAYFNLVERRAGGEWIGRKIVSGIIMFFDECIKPAATWAMLKPHLNELIEHFAFPLVCLTEEDINMFEEDPTEFAKSHIGGFYEDSYSNPAATALSFITSLVSTRKAASLMNILKFVQSICMRYPAETSPTQKDGALRILGALADVATKSKKLAPEMEAFFQQCILPEFQSPYGFLRYRACDIIEKYESCDMEWNNRQNLELMFGAVMGAITDPALPVRIQAAITLPELARYHEVREKLVPNIGRVMQELLKLNNEVDLDSLTNTTKMLVEEFSEEVVPFAVELTESLIASFSRVLRETLELRSKDAEAYDGVYDEKTFVCINILKTIDQLIRSLEKSPLSLDQVEGHVTPALIFTLENDLSELYDEIFEILDSLTYYQKRISNNMWPLFEILYKTFKSSASDYFHEMFGSIDNFITYGSDILRSKPEYCNMLYDMFESVMTSRVLGAEDRVVGCKLAEALFLNMRGAIDNFVPMVVRHSLNFLTSNSKDPDFVVTKKLYLHCLELIVISMHYNASLTLSVLDSLNQTDMFFVAWFKNLTTLNRVHDHKLGMGAICEILKWMAMEGSSSPLTQSADKLIIGALNIFAVYPDALHSKAQFEHDFGALEDVEEEAEGEDDDDLIEDDGKDIYDPRSEGAIDAAILKALEEVGSDDDDDDNDSTWSDEILWGSPLDHLDIYKLFTETLKVIETSVPALFQVCTQNLTPEQRNALERVAVTAQNGGESSIKVQLPVLTDVVG